MSDTAKNIDSLKLSQRKKELNDINKLVDEFGNQAYRAIDRYNTSVGYEAGMERLTRLLNEGHFSKVAFLEDPVKGIEDFLFGYFKDRGGNLPKVWTEKNIVFLMTEFGVSCITIMAEKEIPVLHTDICNLYCRAFVKGMIQIFEDLFPGIQINFYNASSRRNGLKSDCIEAFQVIVP